MTEKHDQTVKSRGGISALSGSEGAPRRDNDTVTMLATNKEEVGRNETLRAENAVLRAPKRGRPTQYAWDLWWLEAMAFTDKCGLPEHAADLERHMADWCDHNWSDTPSSSTLREKISLIYRHPAFCSNRRA